MAEEYLRPEDVRPEHARQVLEYLNSVQSPEEIASAVEIAFELDIGVRLGRRILDRREQLGGFTDLSQIRAIPYIGPERFTEIVITLSDARLPASEVDVGELLREVAALRAEMRALRGGFSPPRVTIRSLREEPFLGQPVDLLVTATEADGIRPRADAAVTLTSVGGRLRAVDGLSLVEGSTVTIRTDGAGTARATLLPLLSETLLPAQEDTLESALALLPASATRPREADEGLRELARRYRWDGNSFLRAAIDVYFRDYGAGLLETVNAHDYMAVWLRSDVSVQAHLRQDADPGPDSTSVQASAALTIRLRNWLGAWLEALQVVTEQEAGLGRDLAAVPPGENANLLVGAVYGRVRDFMSAQRGVVGEYVGRKVAETTLRGFVQNGIANLPAEQQVAVFPALDVASRTVATGGTAMFVAVGQTRTELQKEISNRFEGTIGDIVNSEIFNGLTARLSGVESQLQSKADLADLTAARNELDARIESKADRSAFESVTARISGVESQLQAKANLTDLDATRTEFDARLDSKVDSNVFDTFRRDVDVRIDSRLPVATFTQFQQQTNSLIEAKADRVEFDRLSTDVAREVGSIRTNVTRLDRDMLNLRNR